MVCPMHHTRARKKSRQVDTNQLAPHSRTNEQRRSMIISSYPLNEDGGRDSPLPVERDIP